MRYNDETVSQEKINVPYDRIVDDNPDKEAVLYQFYDGEEFSRSWIPRNLIDGDDGSEITIPEWLAYNEGLI